ncbi:HAD family phosphatase [Candidatus Bathyarchaeota archaeon]|nr:HAD family phosphatase [Candidatus Bathyarchaeota archaeon]
MKSESVYGQKNGIRRRCAIFDVDGTLLKGVITQSFTRYLAETGFIEDKYPNEIDRVISGYRKGNMEYGEAAEAIPNLYASALRGKQKGDVEFLARKFMEAYIPENALSHTEQLISQVQNLVDVTIAVSGSPQEPIAEIKQLGFDYAYGSLFEEQNGIYTGRVTVNLILGEEKAKTVIEVAQELNIDLSRSVAFGNTGQDEPTLNIVGVPVAVNPNKKLRQTSEIKNWHILENKDLKDLTTIAHIIKEKQV